MFDKIVLFCENHPVVCLMIILIVTGLLSGFTGEMHHI